VYTKKQTKEETLGKKTGKERKKLGWHIIFLLMCVGPVD
jgi:hypothetical protein